MQNQLEIIHNGGGQYHIHKAILTLENGEKLSKIIYNREYDAIVNEEDEEKTENAKGSLIAKMIKDYEEQLDIQNANGFQ